MDFHLPLTIIVHSLEMLCRHQSYLVFDFLFLPKGRIVLPTYLPINCFSTYKLSFAVHNKIRVIRGCGYIPDKYDDKDCAKRTGTHEIDAWYCSCTKSLCNTGHLVKDPSLKIVFITSIFMTALASLIRTA